MECEGDSQSWGLVGARALRWGHGVLSGRLLFEVAARGRGDPYGGPLMVEDMGAEGFWGWKGG